MDKLAAMLTFAKVVEAGSFTRAAEALALPKARVSQRIADLEQDLGVRLLHRTTRAMSLTDDGQAYFTQCQLILQNIDELESTLKGGTTVPRGQLRVEALVSVARWIIAPHLHEFQACHPGVSVLLSCSDRISHLQEDGLDCAIRGGALEGSSLIARHICDVQLGLYATPAYLQAQGTPLHPAELAQHRRLSWFRSRNRSPFAWRLETAQDTQDIPATEGLQFDDPEVAMASCMAHSGICPGAPFAVAHWVRSGALRPVLPQWHFVTRPIHIVYPSNKHLSARVRSFVDWSLALMHATPDVHLTPETLARQATEHITP